MWNRNLIAAYEGCVCDIRPSRVMNQIGLGTRVISSLEEDKDLERNFDLSMGLLGQRDGFTH
jgi:hypothetical protein